MAFLPSVPQHSSQFTPPSETFHVEGPHVEGPVGLARALPVRAAGAARAEEWPAKPITVLMGFPAGSGVDVVARMLQPSLEKSLGQRLVLDPKTRAARKRPAGR